MLTYSLHIINLGNRKEVIFSRQIAYLFYVFCMSVRKGHLT